MTIVGFLLHSALGLEAAGRDARSLRSRADRPARSARGSPRRGVAGPLFFFVGLFVLVEAIVHVGIVGGVADWIVAATASSVGVASIALLWFAAVASAVVDNIPYTATAIPIVQQLVDSGVPAEPLWWSLALGACLGGNLTVVGASANIVVANVAARDGNPISFAQFLRYGIPVVAALSSRRRTSGFATCEPPGSDASGTWPSLERPRSTQGLPERSQRLIGRLTPRLLVPARPPHR